MFNERRRKRGEKRKVRDEDDEGDGDKSREKYKTELTQLKSALQKRNRKIAALKKGIEVSDDSDSGENKDDGADGDAGNAFGGKRDKKRSKTKE